MCLTLGSGMVTVTSMLRISAAQHVLDALGNAERRQLLVFLRHGALSVGTLASKLPISRPAVSRHLRVLERAGLVRHTASGTHNLYTLDPSGFSSATDWLTSFWNEAEARFRLVAENLPERRP